MNKKLLTLVMGLGLATALAAVPSSAQNTPAPGGNPPAGDQGGGQGGGRGNRGNRGNFDPAQMRQQRMDRIKTDLAASDEEFKVLQPKIEKIDELRRDEMSARFGGFGGRGRGRGGDNNGGGNATPAPAPTTDNPVAKANTDLNTTLQNKEASPEQIKEKLAALRAARAKAKEELTKAQAALKDLLTPRQEAVLVAQGVLE